MHDFVIECMCIVYASGIEFMCRSVAASSALPCWEGAGKGGQGGWAGKGGGRRTRNLELPQAHVLLWRRLGKLDDLVAGMRDDLMARIDCLSR